MYLKKIEIQGFKSFANKTVMEFQDGITGIVGPNGSGKSNVSDAVRWVLGEMSAKQLRGGNMQDVIFSGTEMRKPQGFAYVALTLDNSDHCLPVDFDEVKVSRRLYRSGESEYMINDSICRLKDISTLFFDTGIGKDGYSIIGQGQIDQILSSKPDDRRELFDEAAGITKFKNRKLLTQKNLDAEHANLVRITDILSELEKQIGPLEKQSESAREYFRLRELQRKYDLNYFLLQTDALGGQLAELDSNINITQSDLEDAGTRAAQLKEKYESIENEVSALDKQVSECREAISAADLQTGDLKGQINVLVEQINTENVNTGHIKGRLEAIGAESSEACRSLREYEEQLEELTSCEQKSRSGFDESESELTETNELIQELEKRQSETNARWLELVNARGEAVAESRRLDAMLEQLQIRTGEIAARILKSETDAESLHRQYEEEKAHSEQLETGLRELKDKSDSAQADCEIAQKAVKEASEKLEKARDGYQATKSRLDALKNIAERYEGYGSATRRVMEYRRKGVHGVVADLISTDKKYETAIETALGGRIQNVVTDTQETARDIIEYLKSNKLGRVTFLPLSAVRSARKTDFAGADREPGIIGTAASLVRCRDEYRTLADSLLGGVLVADSVDHAIALSKKYRYSYHIVTLDGEYLAPGGSISGGAFKNSSNLLGRRREIEELEKNAGAGLAAMDEAAGELERARSELSAYIDELESCRSQEQQMHLESSTCNVTLETLKARIEEYSGSAGSMNAEMQTVSEQTGQIKRQKEEAQERIAETDREKERLDDELVELDTKLEHARTRQQELNESISQLHAGIAENAQKLVSVRENIDRIKIQLDTLSDERDRLVHDEAEAAEHIKSIQADMEETRRMINEGEQKTAELQIALEEALDRRTAMAGRQKQYFEQRDELSERISQIDKDLFRMQNRREKLGEQLDAQVSYIWNEYEMTAQTAADFRDEELSDAGSVRKQAESVKSEIRKLGDINPQAIEQYREVSERYELMKTQHADITKAEEQLRGIIKELDDGMRRQFTEQFGLIRREFDRIFKDLFGGGVTSLELEEPEEGEDILDAGIIISVQPPGKKLQNMMQLSGGEKALTAIALIFAIQSLHPSPFALLDEIEAALDESNVDRFAHYLHRLAGTTQFIVITHRRGTMVAADRLYGITMQEKGVSTLVSVNLIEDELEK